MIKKNRHYNIIIFVLSCWVGFYSLITMANHATLYGFSTRHEGKITHVLSYLMSKIGFSDAYVVSIFYIGITECLFAALVTLLVLYIGVSFISEKKNLTGLLFNQKHLIIIGAILAALGIILQLNGTSIYQWSSVIPVKEGSFPLWGAPRRIRSDEWAVWTPLAVSQDSTNYSKTNNLIAGGNIDTTWISVGGIPANNFALAFKPLYWGFVLFGSSIGISVLWISRIFLLFFTSYYCALIYTKHNKALSIAAAMLITFAPYVQWWFSQSIAEVVLFPELMIISLNAFLNTSKCGKKILLSLLYAWFLGCFIMIGYPAWIIPMLYLLIICSALLLIVNRKSLHLSDALILSVPLTITIIFLLVIVRVSWPTLEAVSDSVYPGDRLFTGKEISQNLFVGMYSLLMPFSDVPVSNPCELSCFLSFAPIGLIISFYGAYKSHKIDGFALILITLELIIISFLLLGFPPFIAKITLMSQCTRLSMILGFIDVVLLFRALSFQVRMPFIPGLLVAIIIASGQIVLLSNMINPLKHGTLLFISLITVAVDTLLLVTPVDKKSNRFLSFSLCLVAIVAGGFVNPIQKGIDTLTESPLIQILQNINDTGENNYLVEGSFPATNIPLVAGKKTFNSTQVYPDTERWKSIDPEGQYQSIYNRFCHVSVELTTDNTDFILLYPDHIKLMLNIADLEKLELHYLLTNKEYNEQMFPIFEIVDRVEDWKIYHISYD